MESSRCQPGLPADTPALRSSHGADHSPGRGSRWARVKDGHFRGGACVQGGSEGAALAERPSAACGEVTTSALDLVRPHAPARGQGHTQACKRQRGHSGGGSCASLRTDGHNRSPWTDATLPASFPRATGRASLVAFVLLRVSVGRSGGPIAPGAVLSSGGNGHVVGTVQASLGSGLEWTQVGLPGVCLL